MGSSFHLLSRLAWIALVICAAGACAYQPGSFAYARQAFPGVRSTLGCLDVAVERRADLPTGPVLGFQFANRCDHAMPIDLAAVSVVGRDATGAEVVLRPYDPQAEIHAVALDGRSGGGEALAYPSSRAMPQVCVDVATLVRGAPAHWLCLGRAAAATSVARASAGGAR